MNKRTLRYIAAMVVLLVAFIICAVMGCKNEIRPICGCFVLVSYVYWVPEDKNKKPPVKGTIQYDRKNYDVPAMRIVFDGEPLNLINYNEVIFKVDRNADLSGLNESK